MQTVDAFLFGRRTYEIHAGAFEPYPTGVVGLQYARQES
jgi:hypothetical protein